jgi:hypothetical protein
VRFVSDRLSFQTPKRVLPSEEEAEICTGWRMGLSSFRLAVEKHRHAQPQLTISKYHWEQAWSAGRERRLCSQLAKVARRIRAARMALSVSLLLSFTLLSSIPLLSLQPISIPIAIATLLERSAEMCLRGKRERTGPGADTSVDLAPYRWNSSSLAH